MTALVPVYTGLANSLAELFAPVDEAPITSLLLKHAEQWETIERVSGAFADPATVACLAYYVSGNDVREGYTVERMFDTEHTARALKALDASYWSQALAATDVLDCMPAKRRDEWHEQIAKFNVPPFTEATLRSTMREHLAARHRYFAERVDGLFRALSPDHKTNMAAGFRSKMILTGITDSFWHSSTRVDYLVDLRIVVARFMGRAIDREYDVRELTRKLIESARRHSRGDWVSVDGGSIELRLYANGNCHVRVHDELAWRLNAVLASVNPGAIPESNQTRPAYTGKRTATAKPAPTLMLRPLPFAVLKVFAEFNTRERDLGPNEWHGDHGFDGLDKHVRAEVLQVLASIGGVEVVDSHLARACGRVRFDYDPADVIREIVRSGCVPDQKAHQFYPTPPDLAARVVVLAEIGPDDRVLEPSAGQGGIADLLPPESAIVCVEASALHCTVLRAKGFARVIHGDFLETVVEYVDRVVMNPPFDRGQWRAHVDHAGSLLTWSNRSRLVAVLPESAARSDVLAGWTRTWSEPIAFTGTSIEVVILVAEPPC